MVYYKLHHIFPRKHLLVTSHLVLPRASDPLKISANINEISLLYSLSTLAFSPSGSGALCTFSPSKCSATPFGSTVMSSMEENRLVPFGVGQSLLHM